MIAAFSITPVGVQGNERVLLERIKELESQGYQFEAAEGSFELLGRKPVRSHLTHRLVELDRQFQGPGWEEQYAAGLVEHFG